MAYVYALLCFALSKRALDFFLTYLNDLGALGNSSCLGGKLYPKKAAKIPLLPVSLQNEFHDNKLSTNLAAMKSPTIYLRFVLQCQRSVSFHTGLPWNSFQLLKYELTSYLKTSVMLGLVEYVYQRTMTISVANPS